MVHPVVMPLSLRLRQFQKRPTSVVVLELALVLVVAVSRIKRSDKRGGMSDSLTSFHYFFMPLSL